MLTTTALTVVWGCGSGTAAPPASSLKAECRSGQVFLTWSEGERSPEAYYVIRSSGKPIGAANVAESTVLARVRPGGADDWWLNPETYGKPLDVDPATGKKPVVPRKGFVLGPGSKPLPADSGLFVHTVTADDPAACFYAVTFVDADGKEQNEIAAGVNSLAEPVSQRVDELQPIWQKDSETVPPAGAGKGKPLHLVLHAKRGRGGMDYLAFGDASLGWREGLPFKFGVAVTDDYVEVRPTDRTWIGRMFPEGKDECQRLTPALHSFWYGYNSNIHEPEQMDEGVATDYTERRLLWIIRWVQQHYETDRNRTYCTGGSMGGCGSMSFAFRHAEIFAAIRPHVPIVEYDKGAGGDSARRIDAECGPLDRKCSDGMPLKERLSATHFVKHTDADLPFVVITNGRKDGSIPWWKNPDFYRALDERRQPFVAAWDDGGHGTCGKELPADVKRWNDLRQFHRFALNKSCLAFSNCSANGDPGNGDPEDGDLVGFMNRGLDYDEPTDTAKKYEVVIHWDEAAGKLPVTVGVTPRRRQAFKPQPGTKCQAINVDLATGKEVQRFEATVEPNGLLTVPQMKLTSTKGNRLTLVAP